MSRPAPPAPQFDRPSSSNDGWIVLALAALVALPALMLGGITLAVCRIQGAKTRWPALAGVLLGGIAWAVKGKALASGYLGVVKALLAHLLHRAPLHPLALVAPIIWVSLPLGLVGAGVADFWLRRRHPKPGQLAQETKKAKAATGIRDDLPTPARKDLKPIRISGPTTGRVVLGRVGGALVATETERHTAIIAPTRSGKTREVIIPAILE